MRTLSRFRPVRPAPPLRRRLAHLGLMVLAGGAMGLLAKWLDFSSQLLGAAFSELPVWILLGLLIARLSGSPGRAAAHVLLFFLAMLPPYYLAAEALGGVWGMAYARVWTAAACLSPLPAFVMWYAFGRGWLPCLLSALGTAAALLADAVVFRSLNGRDFVLALLCALLLFGCKAEGNPGRRRKA